MLKTTYILLALFLSEMAVSQKAITNEIAGLKAAGYEFLQFDLLKFQTADIENREYNLEGLRKGTIVSLDTNAIQALFESKNEVISIAVPLTSRSNIVLTLKRHEIFTEDFNLYTSENPGKPINYSPGLHYRGIVEGDPSSVVGLSVFRDQIMALVSTNHGNFVIGPIKGERDRKHIFYNDRDFKLNFNFECGTEDDALGYTKEQLQPLHQARDVNDCVRLHVEIDDDIVTDKGGAVNATDYVTGMFNQSFIIYTNEGINMVISEIKAWTTNSPYSGSTETEMMSSYKLNTEFFNGDLSQLVTYGAIGASAASTSALCNGNPDLSKGFSHIDTAFNDFPVYSWNVFIITHVVGHLLGSRHTHACVWNGNNTAIDGCYAPEGSCPRPPIPPNGGTIMSFCYYDNTGSYIDMNLGFGEQPGTIIQNSVDAAANCLSPCGVATTYCESTGANSSNEYINKVILGSINNTSGNNGGYGNYTSNSTTLTAGSTYTVTLTPKFVGSHHNESWRVWIDYNHDYDWYDADELVGQASGNNSVNVTFTVPPGSQAVTTRMRVTMKYNGPHTFCGTFPYGEVEDYTVVITAGSETCADGIQNQGETGVDCGGPCQACNMTDTTVLLASYFETGWDSWVDGGADVTRVNSSNSYEGLYSIRLADNSGTQSAMTSPSLNLLSAVGVQINFHFYATSMETGDDFWVRYNNGSGSWTTVATFIAGTNFVNNQYYVANFTIPDFIPTSAGSFRIQSDAGEKNDQVYIDAVTITKLNGTELIETGVSIQKLSKSSEEDKVPDEVKLIVYPNPAAEVLRISINGEIQSIRLMSLEGIEFKAGVKAVEENQIDVHHLAPGLYFLLVQSGNKWYPVKFSKVK